MALATLLLPSSSASSSASNKAAATDHSVRRRHHHGSKRKKKPPPSPQQSSLTPRTLPEGAGTSRHSMAQKVSTTARNAPYQQHHRVPLSKKASTAAATSSSPSSSWEQLKTLLSCRSATAAARVHDPAAPLACGASLCAMRDTAPLARRPRAASSSAAGTAGHSSSLRGLSGCYECRAINVEPMPRRYPRPRELCACSQCGEVFTKAESLDHHQAIRHAVSELGPEDSGRNIVEIIFNSSWQKRPNICHIDRILKVHNAPRTVARFEAYRDAVRARCRAAVAARAAADGNELLRFHSAPLACALGLNGDTSLCAAVSSSTASSSTASSSSSSAPNNGACGVCTAIRHGWVGAHPLGVRTTASSGRAHDCGAEPSTSVGGCRAMLVCRVIAGRVRRDAASPEEHEGPFDSVAGDSSSVYGNLEELFVANPRAILPCFVVIYRVLES